MPPPPRRGGAGAAEAAADQAQAEKAKLEMALRYLVLNTLQVEADYNAPWSLQPPEARPTMAVARPAARPKGRQLLGRRVEIWWGGDKAWYQAIVSQLNEFDGQWLEGGAKGTHVVAYASDGSRSNEDLDGPGEPKHWRLQGEEGWDTDAPPPERRASQRKPSPPRRARGRAGAAGSRTRGAEARGWPRRPRRRQRPRRQQRLKWRQRRRRRRGGSAGRGGGSGRRRRRRRWRRWRVVARALRAAREARAREAATAPAPGGHGRGGRWKAGGKAAAEGAEAEGRRRKGRRRGGGGGGGGGCGGGGWGGGGPMGVPAAAARGELLSAATVRSLLPISSEDAAAFSAPPGWREIVDLVATASARGCRATRRAADALLRPPAVVGGAPRARGGQGRHGMARHGGGWRVAAAAEGRGPALQHVIGGLIRSGHVRAVLPERSGRTSRCTPPPTSTSRASLPRKRAEVEPEPEPEDELAEVEKQRLANIKRNHEMLVALGLA